MLFHAPVLTSARSKRPVRSELTDRASDIHCKRTGQSHPPSEGVRDGSNRRSAPVNKPTNRANRMRARVSACRKRRHLRVRTQRYAHTRGTPPREKIAPTPRLALSAQLRQRTFPVRTYSVRCAERKIAPEYANAIGDFLAPVDLIERARNHLYEQMTSARQ